MSNNLVIGISCDNEFKEQTISILNNILKDFKYGFFFTGYIIKENESDSDSRFANTQLENIIKFKILGDREECDVDHIIEVYNSRPLVAESLMGLRVYIESNLVRFLLDSELYRKHLGFEAVKLLNTFNTLYNLHMEIDRSIVNPYHNSLHCASVATDILLRFRSSDDIRKTTVALYAAFYHDIGYDPHHTDDVNLSIALDEAERYLRYTDGAHLLIEVQTEIIGGITLYLSDLSHWLRTYEEIVEIEQMIFREFEFVDYEYFKQERIKILKGIKGIESELGVKVASMQGSEYIRTSICKGIQHSINYLKTHKPRIGWFCGSFNPFHVGHKHVFHEAEKLFDKVVIVMANNPDKELGKDYNGHFEFITTTREVIKTNDDIPKLLHSVKYKPVLIRGYRNSEDIRLAEEWYQQIKDFSSKDVQMVLIKGNPKYSHVSSSFVRNLLESERVHYVQGNYIQSLTKHK